MAASYVHSRNTVFAVPNLDLTRVTTISYGLLVQLYTICMHKTGHKFGFWTYTMDVGGGHISEDYSCMNSPYQKEMIIAKY